MKTTEDGRGLRAAKNAALLSAIRFIAPVLAVALMLVLSRAVGAEGIGQYALAFGFFAFLNTVAPFGLNAVITREGSRTPERLPVLVGNAATLGAVVSVLLVAGNGIVVTILGYDAATEQAVLLLSLTTIPATLCVFFDAGLMAKERVTMIAYATATEYLIKVGGGVIALLLGAGLDSVLALAVLGKCMACVVSAVALSRLGVSVRPRFNRDAIRWLLQLSPVFLLTSVFATLYWRIDVIMLSKLASLQELGLYGATWRVLEYTMIISASICLALYPQLAAQARRDPGRVVRTGRTVGRYLLAFSVPIAIVSSTSGGWILGAVFGQEFRAGAPILAVLMWTLVPYGLIRFNAFVLLATDRQNIDLALNGVMCGVNIALNVFLIPRFGAFGAAVATLISIITYGFLQTVYVVWKMPGYLVGLPLPLSVAAGGAVVASWTIWLSPGMPLFALFTAPVIYLMCLVVGRFFTRQEVELFKLERYIPSTWLKWVT